MYRLKLVAEVVPAGLGEAKSKCLAAALAEMEAAQEEADGLYARWAELTEKVGA